jgi:hypothetical protein
MLKTTLAGLRYRKGRLALSSLAILLGVAFVTGTLSALQAAPALGVVAPDYFQRAPVNGVGVQVGAIGRSALGISVKPAMISGSLAAVGPGTVGVDSGQLKALGAHQGGTLVIGTPDGGLRDTAGRGRVQQRRADPAGCTHVGG